MPPVRRASNHGKNIIGYFPSLKMGRMVNFESLIERDFIVFLDFEPQVTAFTEQPFSITYPIENKAHRYTPDFHVVCTGGRNLVCECKAAVFQDKPENLVKFAAARTWCEARGWMFLVITDTQLSSGWRIKNIKLLTQFARHSVNTQMQEAILQVVSQAAQPHRLGQVIWSVNPRTPQEVMIPLLHLAYHHRVYLSLNDAPISLETQVSMMQEDEMEENLIWAKND